MAVATGASTTVLVVPTVPATPTRVSPTPTWATIPARRAAVPAAGRRGWRRPAATAETATAPPAAPTAAAKGPPPSTVSAPATAPIAAGHHRRSASTANPAPAITTGHRSRV